MLMQKDHIVAKVKTKRKPLSKATIVKSRTKRPKKLKMKNFQILFNPQKILEEKYYYKIRDVYICDHIPKNEIKSVMGAIRDFKKVVSFFYDKENNLIICNLLDNLEGTPPIKLLVHRLQTLGDNNAYDLSKTLDEVLHITSKEKKIIKKREEVENIFEKKSYIDYLEKTEQLISKFTHDFPIVFWRDSNFENQHDFQLIQIGFNDKLIEILGDDDPQIFGMKLLKKGLPDLIWIKKEYFEMMNSIMRGIFFPESEKRVEMPEFFIKTEQNFIKTKSNYHGNIFEDNDYVELSVVEVLHIDEYNLKLLKPYSSNFEEEKKDDELHLNSIKNLENRNLFIDDNIFKLDTEKWIKNCYPNFKITFLQDGETKKKLRCGFKKID